VENLLSIGDCVSLAVRQCRRDIRFLASKLLWPSVVELFGKLFLVYGARILLVALRGGPQSDLIQAIILMLVGFVICIPAEVWLTMRQLAYVRMIVNRGDDYDLAYKQVRHKFWAVIVYALMFYFAFFIWVFCWAFLFGILSFIAKATSAGIFIVPLILAMMVIAGTTLLILMLPLTLVFVILACEDRGFFAILGRSFKMTFKRFFPTIGFCCALFVTWISIYMALTSVLQVFYGIEYAKNGVYTGKKVASEIQMPLYVQLVSGAWNSIVYMYLMPMFFVSTGFFYYSLRMREEGLDLSHAVEKLEKKRDAISG
jgi:hypothetical protein